MRILPVLAAVFLLTVLIGMTLTVPIASYDTSPQRADDQFTNVAPKPKDSLATMLKLFWDFMFNRPAGTTPPEPPPVRALTAQVLADAPDRSVYRLGHSTLLMKLRGGWWLTDPVFSERASPVQWMGPKRFHAPPIALQDLPPIRGVLLSHDHYDHLDRATIKYLATRAEVFLAPLGVGDRLIDWGVPQARVRQLDWWDETEIDGVRFAATPAQHFSGRGLRDGNRTLWASWVILDDELRVFFSGDTGYFNGFKRIGERYGPFDIAFVETGAYDAKWPFVHMQPEQTVQAHQDLRGNWLVPIHNGTFDLAMHRWEEPFERVSALAAERGIALSTPVMGERLDLTAPHAGTPWWRALTAPATESSGVAAGSTR
ncbi:MBL fold metallo-hydrolase [Stenotrophomonas sp. AB1(2024)]|uniref:MBL fold metallo-hydrolase n=1 Tax=Stenotrophomonas sp. AB1(2024) TaxID=3132215 RepID=UPI0038FA8FAB